MPPVLKSTFSVALWTQGPLVRPRPAAGGKDQLEGGSPITISQGWLPVERSLRGRPSSERWGLHLTLPTVCTSRPTPQGCPVGRGCPASSLC